MDDDELLDDPNFDPAAYVRGRRAGAPAADERRTLGRLRAEAQTAADASAAAVRTNVFQNYYLFIETAKQISYLEGQMYELNHLLGEQRRLLENLHESVLLDTPPLKDGKNFGSEKKGHQQGKNVLQSLMERVDGLAATGTKKDDWSVLLEGDWTELDMDTFGETGRLHAWLLSDALLLAKPSYDAEFRDGVSRYRLDSLLALENVALASVPAREDSRHVLKLLAFPQQRLFACKDAQLKAIRTRQTNSQTNWLQGLESAKRSLVQAGSFQRQRTIRSKSNPAHAANMKQQRRAQTATGGNPFEEDVVQDARDKQPRLEDGSEDLEWLLELPDEIDVCIAQRDFDTALELLSDGRENLSTVADPAVAADVAERLTQRETDLVTLLSNELRGSTVADAGKGALGPATSGGGPKAVRKAATLLVKLGKASLAADLYLKRRTAAVRRAGRRLRLAEDPLSYLRQLCRIVFGALLDVTHEFASLFAADEGCCAVLLLWASGEVRTFSTLVLRHVIEPGTSLALLAHCVRLIFNHCKQLADSGIDLTFEVESLLLDALQKSVADNSQSLVDAAKLRSREEKWRPYNLQAEAHLYRFIEEMIDFGLFLDAYVLDDPPADSMDEPGRSLNDSALGGQPSTPRCRLCVSEAACTFARTVVPLARDLYLVSAPTSSAKLKAVCQTTVCELWRVQLQVMAAAVDAVLPTATDATPPADDEPASVLARSAEFLLNCVLPKCREAFPNAEWMEDPPLEEIGDERIKADYPQLGQFFGKSAAALQKFESIGDV